MRKQIQDAIVDHLKPLQSQCQVAVGALDAEQLKRPVTSGQVFVCYRSSDFSAPQFLGPMVQQQELEFEVISRHVNLRTHDQAFPLLDAIASRLTGFVPVEGCLKPLVIRSEEFVDRLLDSGVWVFSQVFRTTVVFEQTENL